MKLFSHCLLCLFLCSNVLQGQTFLKADGKKIIDENGNNVLLRGMGLGGWMLQEGYMLQTAEFANAQYQLREKITDLIGEQSTQEFYDAWLANHVRKADIDSLKSWGFNSVRLPMHYNLYTLPIEEEPIPGQQTWLEKGFTMTDSLISWCKQNQLYVILDLHAAPGGQGYDQGISDYNPAKPSLWESFENRKKTAALWKRIAERYKDEPWVAGYDLINEPNWDLPGGVLLRNLYQEITDSIRLVDTKHIIFIEGNWFANDFTGLTPPWDDNLVYSPHKYWSFNDQNSIQWVLNLRENYNVPLYLGESGENSNVWFRDAIALLEEHNIGWAWWPNKKVEAIAGPLSVTKTVGYESLLNYWKGNGTKPSASEAKSALLELTENLKIENCIYQKDVIDAMFRQVQSNDCKPFHKNTIPGIIYATNYDLGREGFAYHDIDIATYHVSTSSFTAWNTGWSYRNDGVDIEPCLDNTNTNGYNIGWFNKGEWLKYTVDIQESGVYDIHIRSAAGDFGGQFHFEVDDARVSRNYFAPYTGGYQNWQTITIENIVLDDANTTLSLHSDGQGYNLNSFEFIYKGESSLIPTEFVYAETEDENTIRVHINKALQLPLNFNISDVQVLVNGPERTVLSISEDEENSRNFLISLDQALKSTDIIKLNYTGSNIFASDNTLLDQFNLKDVQNNLPTRHKIPGRIQAEDFSVQSGVEIEITSDVGGGNNIGFLDIGDYLDYDVEVLETGLFNVTYRTASASSTGGMRLDKVNEDGSMTFLHQLSFPPTGDWQEWEESEKDIFLSKGTHTLRMTITASNFNMNWFEFGFLTNSTNHIENNFIQVYPNPALTYLKIFTNGKHGKFFIYDNTATLCYSSNLNNEAKINIEDFSSGLFYIVFIDASDGKIYSEKFLKQ